MAMKCPVGLAALWGRYGSQLSLSEVLGAMRDEEDVMSISSLRRIRASSVSFGESLHRRIAQDNWSIREIHRRIEVDLSGEMIFEIRIREHQLHFVVYANADGPGPRDGRLRDNGFDLQGVLYEGALDWDRIRREGDEIREKVWGGRTANNTLAWTFANRSSKLFQDLRSGAALDLNERLNGGGYILRNSGAYANGRHGSHAWVTLPEDHPLKYPYRMDMFCLYLWRLTGFALIDDFCAKNPRITPMSEVTKSRVGVGNSSGIGTVATLVRWPSVLAATAFAREFAVAHALVKQRALRRKDLDVITERLDIAIQGAEFAADRDVSGLQLVDELQTLRQICVQARADSGVSAKALIASAESAVSREALEELRSALTFADEEGAAIAEQIIPLLIGFDRATAPERLIGEELVYLTDEFGWALNIDLTTEASTHYFWYKSEQNGENRRGERRTDEGVDRETFVNMPGAVQEYAAALAEAPDDWTLGRLLLARPELSMVAARVNLSRATPCTTIHGNIIHQDFRPADLIRYFLSILGLTHLTDNSIQWVTGIGFSGVPVTSDSAVEPEVEVLV